MARELGNVTEETEITFEYRLKNLKELVKMEDLDLTLIQSFPFQAQITYSALDGSKCVRIISNQQQISSDREELEKNANFQILSTNAIQQSSKLAKRGDIKQAQVIAKTWKRRMRGNISNKDQERDYAAFNNHFGDVYNMMNDANEEADELQPIQEAEEEHMATSMRIGAVAMGSAQPRMAAREEAKKDVKKKEEKGIFAKFSDKMSAGLFKASKMNKNQFSK